MFMSWNFVERDREQKRELLTKIFLGTIYFCRQKIQANCKLYSITKKAIFQIHNINCVSYWQKTDKRFCQDSIKK